ncbi:increased recombination centers protein 22 [Zygosaccharomyces mellis]|uniref:Increased recombination centers protein 22 n=1 Tax=Zygosaccharomyces mellis TaxID=42258 RepID=A0A4C2E5V6_9SACH|nr:increased recombination centers protein 22 [Zygosaccharomyces mellis]
MKLFQFTLCLLVNICLTLASNSSESIDIEKSSNETAVEEPSTIDFDVGYNILEHLDTDLSRGVEFSMQEVATFNYSFTNNENVNVSVIGVAGTVISTPDGYQVANITEQSIGPVEVGVNKTVNFQAGVQLILPEGTFYMLPVLNVIKDEEPLKVGIRPLLITVNPPPLSFFNPSFLSVQILLGLLIAGATYAFMTFNKSETKRRPVKNAKPVIVDQSWLPDNYKKAEKHEN